MVGKSKVKIFVKKYEAGFFLQILNIQKMAAFWAIALMMEAARTSETSVNFYQTSRRYNPEDSHLRTHRRENLKSCLISTYRGDKALKK
jgi:hypothetical protein